MARLIRRYRLRDQPGRPIRRLRSQTSAKSRSFLPKAGKDASRFLLETLIGSGGMFEVWAALDVRRAESGDRNPRVAVKRLLPELEGFQAPRLTLAQEYCTLRNLAHPGVVRVFDLHREAYGLCFSMELLGGQTWYALGQEGGNGVGKAALPLAARLFETLAYLHEKGITHGDVKPANIVVSDNRVVMTDFHVADTRSLPGPSSASLARKLRNTLNLPVQSRLHASPDCLITDHAHPADDVFAACCSVYELLTGKHPFSRLSSLEAWGKGLRPTKPAGLGLWHWAMLRQGLKFVAAQRPSAQELARAFSSSLPFKGGGRMLRSTLSFNG